MRYILYAIPVFCAISMSSCKEKRASGPAVINRQFSLPTGTPGTTPANPVLPGNKPAVASSGTATINPPHGQPGHRCDVAVGAPIPASLQTANALSSISTNLNPGVQPLSLPTPNNAAAGLNPKHGEPGHRCDIAVGAPLNSKPNAKTPSATTVTNPITTKPTALAPDTLFAKGLNPAHGQPGHRCDIAVGKPLTDVKKANPLPSTIAAPLKPAGN